MEGELPQTERRNDDTRALDTLDTQALVETLVADQRAAIDAVLAQRESIAAAADEIAARLARGGSLHYVGAGTSGRLGVLDASEMPPTFGTDPQLVCAHIAGGARALQRAVEGAEDDAAAGAAEMAGHAYADDAVVGISASGGASYVLGAIERARAIGAYTVAIVNSAPSPLSSAAERSIVLATGAEALTGSTRLKAGTSQKVALNAISTAVMVRLGKVHENLMVDVVATNAKLHARATRLVQLLAGVDEARSKELLAAAQGRVKVAIVMAKRSVDAASAQALLEDERGFLRQLL